MSGSGRHRRISGSRMSGFTLLEIQVTLAILAVGLVSFGGLLAMQAKQIRHVEQWCRSEPTYYVVSQTDRWMRQLGAAASLETLPGQTAWSPPVTAEQVFRVVLEFQSRDVESRTITARAKLEAIP